MSSTKALSNDRRVDTVLGPEIQLVGQLKAHSDVAVRGSVDGIVEAKGTVIVHEEGKLNGQIAATDVIVKGWVEGNIKAAQNVKVCTSARVNADIQAASVEIAKGSFYEGRIQMRGPRGES